MIYFTPVVSSGPPCAIPPPSQETSPPRVERLLRGSTEKPLSHLFPSANAKTYNMDCKLKSIKLIFSDLKRAQHFSSSRDFCAGRERRCGAGGGAGPCADPRCPPPTEVGAAGRMGRGNYHDGRSQTGTAAEGPYICRPMASPWRCAGPHRAPARPRSPRTAGTGTAERARQPSARYIPKQAQHSEYQ